MDLAVSSFMAVSDQAQYGPSVARNHYEYHSDPVSLASETEAWRIGKLETPTHGGEAQAKAGWSDEQRICNRLLNDRLGDGKGSTGSENPKVNASTETLQLCTELQQRPHAERGLAEDEVLGRNETVSAQEELPTALSVTPATSQEQVDAMGEIGTDLRTPAAKSIQQECGDKVASLELPERDFRSPTVHMPEIGRLGGHVEEIPSLSSKTERRELGIHEQSPKSPQPELPEPHAATSLCLLASTVSKGCSDQETQTVRAPGTHEAPVQETSASETREDGIRTVPRWELATVAAAFRRCLDTLAMIEETSETGHQWELQGETASPSISAIWRPSVQEVSTSRYHGAAAVSILEQMRDVVMQNNPAAARKAIRELPEDLRAQLEAESLNFVSLMSGIGGRALGYELDSWRWSGVAVEAQAECANILQHNSNSIKVCKHFSTAASPVPPDVLASCADITVQHLEAGPPCQPYSSAGLGKGADDPRDGIPATVEAITRLQPLTWEIENVPQLAQHEEVMESIVEVLSRQGYHVQAHVMVSSDFGVPQHRRRLIITGSKLGPLELPPGSCDSPITVGEIIGKNTTFDAFNDYIPHLKLTKGQEMRADRVDFMSGCKIRRELHPDKPARTLTAANLANNTALMMRMRMGDGVTLQRPSVEQAAALQSFPTSFAFPRALISERQAFRAVGNAMPPLMGKALTHQVRIQIDEARALFQRLREIAATSEGSEGMRCSQVGCGSLEMPIAAQIASAAPVTMLDVAATTLEPLHVDVGYQRPALPTASEAASSDRAQHAVRQSVAPRER